MTTDSKIGKVFHTHGTCLLLVFLPQLGAEARQERAIPVHAARQSVSNGRIDGQSALRTAVASCLLSLS